MRVLITGGGIAGPANALFMARTGARVTLLEKEASTSLSGQNIDVQGTARTVLRKMGVYDEVLRNNTTETGTQFIDRSGKVYATLPLSDANTITFTSRFEILRADLARIFIDAIKKYSNVDVAFGKTVTRVLSNDEKSVKVELSDGQVQEYDLLVAADGQWSRTRKMVFPEDEVGSVDKNMYSIYYTIPKQPQDGNVWSIYQASKSRNMSTRPDPHGTTRATLTIVPRGKKQKEEWEKASRADRATKTALVRKEFQDAGWQEDRFVDMMDKAEDFYFQAVKQIKMKSWHKNRVVCLGDAAYAPTPLTGMGTSLAILGGYVLAGEISKLKEGERLTQALEAYEKEFRPFVENTQNIPPGIPSIAHPQSAWGLWVTRGLIRLLATVAEFQGRGGKKRPDHSDKEDYKLPKYPALELETN